MKPALLILAAGMGSRYGGIKQIEPVGRNGEIILEYSLFDAIRAGFGRAVFVIRRDIREDFEQHVLPRFSRNIPCTLVYQDMDDLPEGYSVPDGRKKPWGTAHAVLAARKELSEPFAVINADDFYGEDAYRVMAEFLSSLENREKRYAMVGYELARTVSENGSVSRGICQVDASGMLTAMEEHTKIEKTARGIVSRQADGSSLALDGDTPVSMNLFGFTPAVLPDMESLFADFLAQTGPDEKSEFYIPTVANHVVKSAEASMKVLRSSADWFGITYQEDRPEVVANIGRLVDAGRYPTRLWG